MGIRSRIKFAMYGSSILEAYTLDMLLDTLSDGYPRVQKVFYEPSGDISAFDLSRKIDQLLEDNYIKPMGSNFIITSKGKLHLSKGGYQTEIKHSRRTTISFWLSIAAFLISLSALLIKFFDS
ncbi:hypothetical protein [Aquimarina algiphila]|uniref:hypothetical protein n=1 Tax=Aquimarina algiphila TaxID=2047982 RepID=UPI00232A8251|nr:hypothetical protein [Aquimarina algiphila]